MSRLCVTSAIVAGITAWSVGCAPALRSTATGPLEPRQMAEFWEDVDPRSRDLLHGVAGPHAQPNPDAVYTVKTTDTSGFSITYDVADEAGVEWSVKMGDEAQSEVTSSRIVWAMGYQQPPNSYLPRWNWRDGEARRLENGGRFRPKLPTLKTAGIWAWHQNPFVGTQAFRGLLVLMMVLNSTDLKDDNNVIYERHAGDRVAGRWYVVKDLGATLGTTGRVDPKRNDIDAFEPHGFITGVRNGHVRFAFKGRAPGAAARDHTRRCRVDVQPPGASHAGAMAAMRSAPAGTRRRWQPGYIRRIQQKIAEGQALQGQAKAGRQS